MIGVRQFSFRYRGSQGPALEDLSFEIPAGQFCAVVGGNQSGKSTLCYALTGFMPQFFAGESSGTIHIEAADALSLSPGELAGTVGLLFQNPFNQISGSRFTVREEIAFGLENLGVPREEMIVRVEATLALTGLEDLAERSPIALSGGQQQRLAIASVLAMRPRFLVLDEPTSQLDPVGTREVFTALHRLTANGETTILMAEHKLEWVASFADRVLALKSGKIVADGPPRDILGAGDMQVSEVGQTRYTRAARQARARRIVTSNGPLPVTLEQAVEFFK